MAFTQTQVSQLYVSVFGRASEGEGNTFWQAKEGTMASLADEMLASPASIEYFGETLDDNQAFIEFIYNNTLGKTIEEDPDGIAYWVGRLDAGDSKGQIVATMVAALVDGDFTGDADALAAQAQFNNRVEVSNYCADTIETAEVADLAEFAAYINGVTDDPDTADDAIDAIDDAAAVPLTLTAGLDAIDDANDAVADFLDALELDMNNDGDLEDVTDVEAGDATADSVHTDYLDAAVAAYDAAVDAASASVDATEIASDYANQSGAISSAVLADAEDEVAEALADAQEDLATRDAEIAAVDGLTDAVAALEAAEDALAAAEEAVGAGFDADSADDSFTVASQVAAAEATAALSVLADITDVTVGDDDTNGADDYEYSDVTDADDLVWDNYLYDNVEVTSTALGAITLAEFDADAEQMVLTDAATELGYDADTTDEDELADIALFESYQDKVATLVDVLNSEYADAAVLNALDDAVVDAGRDVSYIDASSDVDDSLEAFDGEFTLTTPADDEAPTRAEVAAEADALASALTAANTLAADADDAIVDAVADYTAATADADVTVTLDLATDTFTIVDAQTDDGGFDDLELITASVVDGVLTAAFDTDGASDDGILDTLLSLSQDVIDTAVAAAAASADDISFAALETTLNGFLDAQVWDVVNGDADDSDVTTDYADLETAVTDAEGLIEDLADAQDWLATAESYDADLTALEDAATDAQDALIEAFDFDNIEDVDAASEFSTAGNDLFIAGAVNSTVYSPSLLGDDALYVGSTVAYNDTLIGSDEDAGETLLADAGDVAALEYFMAEVGTNVEVYIETEAYGSETGDYTTITLTGVALDDVTVADGLISIV